MEYNADKLDIASLDSACAALLSVNNLQTLSSNIGASLGQIDFSHVPNVTGAKVGSCSSCLSSVCGTHGATPATQTTYNNLYNTVNLLYKSEAEAQGLFGGQTSDANLDFSKYFLDNFASNDYQYGNEFFGETGGSELTGAALRSACKDALAKGERTNLDNYYIIKYFEDLEGRYLEAKTKYDEGALYAMDTVTLDTLAYSTGYGDLAKEYAALQTDMKSIGLLEKTGWDEIKDAATSLKDSGKDVVTAFKTGEGILSSIRDFGKQVLSTNAVVSEKVVAGVAKVGEGLDDGLNIIRTTLATPATYVTDALLGTNATKQMWNNTMDYVALDRVGLAEKQLYENTKVGQWINENSALKYDSAGAEAIKNFTTKAIEDAGVIGITIASGGTFAPAAIAAFKGIEALGASGEERFSQTNEAGEYTNRGVKDVALAYVDGAVEFAEGYGQALATGAAINGVKAFSQAGGMEGVKALFNKDALSSAGAYLRGNVKSIAKNTLATTLKEADTWFDAGTQFAPFVKDSLETGKIDSGELLMAMGNAGLTFALNAVGNFGGIFADKVMSGANNPVLNPGRVGTRGADVVNDVSVDDVGYALIQEMNKTGCSFNDAVAKLELAILDEDYSVMSNYGGSRNILKQYDFDELGAILDNIKYAEGIDGTYMHTADSFMKSLAATGNDFGANQGRIYDLYDYEYEGKRYKYKAARNMVNEAMENGDPIPRFTEVPSERYIELKNKIRREFGFTNGEAAVVLASIDDAGACSYAAVCNEIFDSFKNDEEAFEKAFGFPMYVQGKTGDVLNTEELLADMYIKVNSRTTDSLIINNGDGTYSLNRNKLSGKVDPIGRPMLDVRGNQEFMATSSGQNRKLINEYLADKGLTFSTKTFDHYNSQFPISDKDMKMITDTIKERRVAGYEFSLGIYKGTEIRMVPLEQNLLPKTTNRFRAGHQVYVAGVADDGFIVSSWGHKYLIPFKDLQREQSLWALSIDSYK